MVYLPGLNAPAMAPNGTEFLGKDEDFFLPESSVVDVTLLCPEGECEPALFTKEAANSLTERCVVLSESSDSLVAEVSVGSSKTK